MIFWSFRGNTTKTIMIRISSEELQSDANMQEKLIFIGTIMIRI